MTLVRIHPGLDHLGNRTCPLVQHRHHDHPPLPAARALDRLRPGWDRPDDPITWTHRDPAGWAAVTSLYRAGHCDDAHALGVLLAWCEAWPLTDTSHWRLDPDDADGGAQ